MDVTAGMRAAYSATLDASTLAESLAEVVRAAPGVLATPRTRAAHRQEVADGLSATLDAAREA